MINFINALYLLKCVNGCLDNYFLNDWLAPLLDRKKILYESDLPISSTEPSNDAPIEKEILSLT